MNMLSESETQYLLYDFSGIVAGVWQKNYAKKNFSHPDF